MNVAAQVMHRAQSVHLKSIKVICIRSFCTVSSLLPCAFSLAVEANRAVWRHNLAGSKIDVFASVFIQSLLFSGAQKSSDSFRYCRDVFRLAQRRIRACLTCGHLIKCR